MCFQKKKRNRTCAGIGIAGASAEVVDGRLGTPSEFEVLGAHGARVNAETYSE